MLVEMYQIFLVRHPPSLDIRCLAKMWPGMLDYMADARQRLGKARNVLILRSLLTGLGLEMIRNDHFNHQDCLYDRDDWWLIGILV